MMRSNGKTQVKNDEFSRIFDEYRTKIEEITRRTENNMQKDGPSVHDNDNGKIDSTVVVAVDKKPEPGDSLVEVEWQSEKAAEEIINEANRKAELIVYEAEERIKKEAKKKTQSKVDKILEKARKDAEEMVVQAKLAIEKERNDIVDASKQEAEQLIKGITEQYREETRAHSSQVISQARQTAETILAEIVANGNEISEIISNIVGRARNSIGELERNLKAEKDALNRIIGDTEARIEQINTLEPEIINNSPAQPHSTVEDEGENVLYVKLSGEKTEGNNGNSPLFAGQMELKALSSLEYKQVKAIKGHLVSTPNIQYMQEHASEKEISVSFEVKEPVPIINIFKSLPLVEKVDENNGGLSLTLKPSS